MKSERIYGADAVRCAASVFVIAVHFFVNTGYYDLPLRGEVMALCTWLRMMLMVCVPLFMMLTGYLSSGRTVREGWLHGLWRTLSVWIVSAAICLLFRRCYFGERFRFGEMLTVILNFSAVPYGWYVEMYVGLYLLSPLMSAAWSAMDERGKRAAVLSLLFLTALPTVTNLNRQILPQWWTGIYPLTYFVLGAWLREHPLRKLRKWHLLLLWAVIAGIAAAMRWLFAMGGSFTWTAYTDWGSIFVAAESVCAFSLLNSCSGARTPRLLRNFTTAAARLSLAIYLSSYIADSLLYPILCRRVETMAGRLAFQPLMTAAVFLCAGLIGWFTNHAAEGLMQLMPQKRQRPES